VFLGLGPSLASVLASSLPGLLMSALERKGFQSLSVLSCPPVMQYVPLSVCGMGEGWMGEARSERRQEMNDTTATVPVCH